MRTWKRKARSSPGPGLQLVLGGEETHKNKLARVESTGTLKNMEGTKKDDFEASVMGVMAEAAVQPRRKQ